MRNVLYFALWNVFHVRSVRLVDHDGQQSLRLLRRTGSVYWAQRRGTITAHVKLLPFGKTQGTTPVERWLPAYRPKAPDDMAYS